MTAHPTPPAAASDAAIAQALREVLQPWSAGTYALIMTRAAEIQAARTLDAQPSGMAGDALHAEIARLTQLVSGGKGGLPEGAIAWLDMGKGEAGLTFSKKSDSNRASKRNAMELFNRVPAGYYPLYLSPQDAPPIAQQGGGEVTDAVMERIAREMAHRAMAKRNHFEYLARALNPSYNERDAGLRFAYDNAARMFGELAYQVADQFRIPGSEIDALASKADG